MPGFSAVTTVDNITSVATLFIPYKVCVTAIRTINTSGTSPALLHVYDASSITGITVGTTIPRWTVVAASGEPSAGDGLPTDGLMFQNGVVLASTNALTSTTGVNQHVRVCIR